MLIQSKVDECGKSVVREILALTFKSSNFYTEELLYSCKDFYEIRETLLSYGIEYESYKIDDFSCIEKKMYPLIAQIIQGEKLHFVIVKKIINKSVVILDPQFGKYTLTLKEFLNCFTGRVLVRKNVLYKRKKDYIHLLKRHEICLYCFFTLLSSLSLVCFLLYSFAKNTFLICFIFFVISIFFLLLINGLNIKVRNRLEKDVLLPYVEKTKNKEDYLHLNNLITLTIKTTSSICSYFICCIGLITILLFNSMYFSFLFLIGILFSILRWPLKEEQNATNRYCSIKEEAFFSKLGNEKNAREEYYSMKKRVDKLISLIVLTWVLEILSSSIFSLAILNITSEFSYNTFFFYFSMSISISIVLNKLIKELPYAEKKAYEINALSEKLEVEINKFSFKKIKN